MASSCRTWRVVEVVMVMAMMSTMTGKVEGEEGVALMWGIADTTASVGRLFRYHIPSDAFQGPVTRYEVVEAGKDHLPPWLHFLSDQNLLKGLPTPGDAGQVYLEVTAHGPGDDQRASDVFSVSVGGVNAQAMSSGQPLRFQKAGPEVVRCKREEPETVATIVVDADLSGMGVEDRLRLAERFLGHMGLQEDMLKMVPAKANLLQDNSALVTGSGDAVDPRHLGVSLSWLVGCGKVEKGHFPVLQTLDEDSGSGTLGRVLGHPVVGWRVTNTRLQQQQQQQHALKRRRRQIRATPTPGITITPPTATDGRLEPTETDTMTHKVVVMSSPTFPIEPTPTQPDMPQTTTTTTPATTTTTTTTTTKKKPDVEPSKPPVKPPTETETPTLPTTTTTTTPTTTTTTTTTTTSTTTSTTTTTTEPTTTTTSTTTTTEKPRTKKPPVKPVPKECLKPRAMRATTKAVFLVGEMVNYRIPEDLFQACDQGGTSQTDLVLFRNVSSVIPKDWFLEFNQKTQTIQGVALEENVGSYNMTLVASLKDQAFITLTNLRIIVRRPKGRKARLSHEMSMTLDANYKEFMEGGVKTKLDLASKVARVFGDENTSALTITGIREGSVVYRFTNNTLTGGSCPVDDITALADKLVTQDGSLHPDALEKLKPFVLTGAAVAPKGSCQGRPDFPARSASVVKTTLPAMMTPTTTTAAEKPDERKTDTPPDMPDKTTKAKATAAPSPPNITGVATAGKTSDDDIWITTVVPAVVIVFILLVALLIACVLYRKKRKGKMTLEDKNTFVNKGAPVIFPDELEDKPHDSTKPLLIEGSPPAPPPEYRRGQSASPPDARNNYHHHPHHQPYNDPHRDVTPPTDEVDAEIEVSASSPLYQPPPPVTANSGKQARPQPQQPYRSQPPEIHP